MLTRYLDVTSGYFIRNLNDPSIVTIDQFVNDDTLQWQLILCVPPTASISTTYNPFLNVFDSNYYIEVAIGTSTLQGGLGVLLPNITNNSYDGNIVINTTALVNYTGSNLDPIAIQVSQYPISGSGRTTLFYNQGLVINVDLLNTTASLSGGFVNLAVLSSSYASTASYLLGTIQSASYAVTSSWALNCVSASYAKSASHADNADNSITSSDTNYFVGHGISDFLLIGDVSSSQYGVVTIITDTASRAFTNANLTVAPNGNVAVGGSTSSYKFYVNGTAKTENDLVVKGVTYAGDIVSPCNLSQIQIAQRYGYDAINFINNDTGNVMFRVDPSGSITASGLFGTSSWAVHAISASYANSASYVLSSSYAITASYAFTSSYSLTASYISGGNNISCSHAIYADTSSICLAVNGNSGRIAMFTGIGFGPNLIINGGFEITNSSPDVYGTNRFPNWTSSAPNSAHTNVTSDAHSGNLAMMRTGSGSPYSDYHQDVSVNPNTPYRLSFWSKSPYSRSFSLYDYNNGVYMVPLYTYFADKSATYAQYIYDFITPSNTIFIAVGMEGNSENGTTVEYDDVSLNQLILTGSNSYTVNNSLLAEDNYSVYPISSSIDLGNVNNKFRSIAATSFVGTASQATSTAYAVTASSAIYSTTAKYAETSSIAINVSPNYLAKMSTNTTQSIYNPPPQNGPNLVVDNDFETITASAFTPFDSWTVTKDLDGLEGTPTYSDPLSSSIISYMFTASTDNPYSGTYCLQSRHSGSAPYVDISSYFKSANFTVDAGKKYLFSFWYRTHPSASAGYQPYVSLYNGKELYTTTYGDYSFSLRTNTPYIHYFALAKNTNWTQFTYSLDNTNGLWTGQWNLELDIIPNKIYNGISIPYYTGQYDITYWDTTFVGTTGSGATPVPPATQSIYVAQLTNSIAVDDGTSLSPAIDLTYNLGDPTHRWNIVYANVISASISGSSSNAVSASYAVTASYSLNGGSSPAASSGTQSLFATQSLYSTQSLYATQSINATSSLTASYISSSAIFDKSVYTLTSSVALTASYVTATGSYVLYLQSTDGNTYAVSLANDGANVVLAVAQTPTNNTNSFINVGNVNISSTASYFNGTTMVSPVNIQTSNYSLKTTDYVVVFSGSSALSASLPAATILSGIIWNIKNVSTYNLTITSSTLIDNAYSWTVPQWNSMNIISNGSQYLIL